jgi:hypothetical protein
MDDTHIRRTSTGRRRHAVPGNAGSVARSTSAERPGVFASACRPPPWGHGLRRDRPGSRAAVLASPPHHQAVSTSDLHCGSTIQSSAIALLAARARVCPGTTRAPLMISLSACRPMPNRTHARRPWPNSLATFRRLPATHP